MKYSSDYSRIIGEIDQDAKRPLDRLVMQWAIFRKGKEQTQFGRFDTSQDAMCVLMMTGIAGYVLAEFSVFPVEE